LKIAAGLPIDAASHWRSSLSRIREWVVVAHLVRRRMLFFLIPAQKSAEYRMNEQ